MFWRDPGTKGQIPDRARRVVEPDAAAVEPPPGRRLVDFEGSVEHVLPADIEQQIPKILVPIRQVRAVVIEDAVDRVGLRIERDVVEAEIAMDEGTIRRTDRRLLVALDDLIERTDKTTIVDDASLREQQSAA